MTKTIVVHKGAFHADDVGACHVLCTIFDGAYLIRTRDPEAIAKADFAVDVGMVYDPARGRFDHHQRGGAGARKNNVPYASSGLVWKAYGAEYCRCLKVPEEHIERVVKAIDLCVMQGIDAIDTGYRGKMKNRGSLSSILGDFNPTWEDFAKGADQDEPFVDAMILFGQILRRKIKTVVADLNGREVFMNAPAIEEGRVVILDDYVPWKSHIDCRPGAVFVVYPGIGEEDWCLQAVEVPNELYSQKVPLPANWGGLSGAELDAVTGIKDCVFCHNSLFICGHKTREGIIQMAQLALAA